MDESREVAFGACPGAVVRLRPGAGPDERWLIAVALGGQGRYAAAATILHRLLTDPLVPLRVAAHAAVTLAAHRRQLGGHAIARRLDALGLRWADAVLRRSALRSVGAPDRRSGQQPDRDGTDAPAARVDALIGLAADALGTGDLRGSHRLLAAAAAQHHPAWRPVVRADWVRAELALLEGRPADAVAPATEALAAAEQAGAVRHVLKSRIVLAVARAAADPRAAPAAVAELDEVRRAATADVAGSPLLPLCWPAALAAADLVAADPVAVETRRHAALTTVSVLMDYADPVGRRLMGESVWVPRVAVGSLVAPLGPLSPT